MVKKINLFIGLIVLLFLVVFSFVQAQETTTVSNLEELVQTLRQQIEVLKKEISQLQNQITTLKTIAFGQNLVRGTEGEEVRQLQEFLAKDPEVYPEGLVTGYFGPLTEAAVKRFQEKHRQEILTPLGLREATGVVGQATRVKLNELTKSVPAVSPGFTATSTAATTTTPSAPATTTGATTTAPVSTTPISSTTPDTPTSSTPTTTTTTTTTATTTATTTSSSTQDTTAATTSSATTTAATTPNASQIPAGAIVGTDGWCFDADIQYYPYGDYYVKSYCQDHTGTYDDYCLNSNRVVDWYCARYFSSGGILTSAKCSYAEAGSMGYACSDGALIKTITSDTTSTTTSATTSSNTLDLFKAILASIAQAVLMLIEEIKKLSPR